MEYMKRELLSGGFGTQVGALSMFYRHTWKSNNKGATVDLKFAFDGKDYISEEDLDRHWKYRFYGGNCCTFNNRRERRQTRQGSLALFFSKNKNGTENNLVVNEEYRSTKDGPRNDTRDNDVDTRDNDVDTRVSDVITQFPGTRTFVIWV